MDNTASAAPQLDQARPVRSQTGDGYVVLDFGWRVLFINPAAVELLGLRAADLVGRDLWEVLPEAMESGIRPEAQRAAIEQVDVQFEAYYPALNRRLDICISPGTKGVIMALRDIAAGGRTTERTRLLALSAEVGGALVRGNTLRETLQECALALYRNLDAAFARIWVMNPETKVLELQASAGLYTHLDGHHSRILPGQLKIGMIAQERKPHLTNQVLGDPRVSDQDWARREGMVAFAGYPLLIENQVVGVMALFARHELPPDVLEAMESVTDELAVGIRRKQAEDLLREMLAREREARRDAEELAAEVERQREELEVAYEEQQASGEELEVAIEELRVHHLELDALRQESETVRRIGQTLAAELDLELLVQRLTDEATQLVGAGFGAFFYNVVGPEGEAYTLYSLAGVPREAFAKFPMPRNTAIFAPTFNGNGVVRRDDIKQDPRYGRNAPYHGMPKGHLPVCSYLAVPVVSRSGEVLGGLFFGHEEPGVFTESHERMIVGIAAQAAVAMDNARLYRQAREAEAALRLSRERLDLVVESTELGLWYCDLPSRLLTANEKCKELFGFSSDAEVTLERFFERIHRDDHERTRAAMQASIQRGAPFDVEYRSPAADGGTRWVRALGRCFRDASGTPIRFDGVAVDVTRQKETEQALREDDRRKDEFLAMLSHELRNPLAPIRNAAEVLRSEGASGSSIERARSVIERQVHQMTRLVDDLLDVSRITRGKVVLRKERVNLGAVVTNAVQTSRPLIEAREHRLSVSLPQEPLELEGDSTRLEQVFANLLNNAAKYTDPGGSISVEVERDGKEAVVGVRDSGVGLGPDLLPRVFDLFVQAERSADRSQGGLGIGLTLVRNLVELHGGTVEAQSEGLGRGCEFVVRLPILAAAVVDPTSREPDPALGHQACCVLVVDDSVDGAETLADLLQIWGHEVRLAFDGPTALTRAIDFQPAVVLLDIGLPGMDGYEVARRLRREAAFPANALLVALTGYGQDSDRRRALQAGFDEHLTKPVDLDALRTLLARVGCAGEGE